ncbi:MAG: hypothetical protein Q9187_008028 [Circinaria calcarea]
MAEPQPQDIREGADPEDDNPAVPASAEERKTAAALSSLDARNDDEDTPSQKTNVDQEALGKAMSQLGVNGGEKEKGKAKEAEVKKKVKVEAVDVALLVEELELSKAKATELLKAHEGDAVKAMRAFVTASA